MCLAVVALSNCLLPDRESDLERKGDIPFL